MAHETIVLEAVLVDYAPPLVAENPFRDKKKNKKKKDVGVLGSSVATSGNGGGKAQAVEHSAGKVQVRDPITSSFRCTAHACHPT